MLEGCLHLLHGLCNMPPTHWLRGRADPSQSTVGSGDVVYILRCGLYMRPPSPELRADAANMHCLPLPLRFCISSMVSMAWPSQEGRQSKRLKMDLAFCECFLSVRERVHSRNTLARAGPARLRIRAIRGDSGHFMERWSMFECGLQTVFCHRRLTSAVWCPSGQTSGGGGKAETLVQKDP